MPIIAQLWNLFQDQASFFPKNLYLTFSNCFQLVQNLFEDIVEAHQGNLQPLSLFMYLPGSNLSDWFSHQCSRSSVTVHLPPVSDHKILVFAVCGVTKFNYAHYTSDLSALCFCTFKGEHGERCFCFDLLDLNITRGSLLESDYMILGHQFSSIASEGVEFVSFMPIVRRCIISFMPIVRGS
ncbi:unnamed protein product [Malus baccata var. baccata]